MSTAVDADRFHYGITSTVHRLSRSSGSVAGGMTLTITGSAFTATSKVRFGSVAATSVTVLSGTSITAVAPAHEAGLVGVHVITAYGTSASTAVDHYRYAGDTLGTGQSLGSGQMLWSRDNRYLAIMQTDGNFVVYGPSGALWSTATTGTGSDSVVMQGDGNLVVYSDGGHPHWSSGTAPGYRLSLVMQTDGNLVIYGPNGIAVWDRGSGRVGSEDTLATNRVLTANQALYSTDGRYMAIMQGDGNFVVYGPTGARWATGTGGTGPNNEIVMQGDGNLVVYAPGGKALWSSSTAPSTADRLVVQTDGNLVIYDGGGHALWALGRRIGGGTPPFTYCYAKYNQTCVSQWGYTGQSAWGYPVDAYGNNCTNYAAFRLSQTGHSNPGNLGDATNWAVNARAKGLVVDHTPTVGSVAQWNYGHVAFVEWVSPDGSQFAVSETGFDEPANGFPSFSGRGIFGGGGRHNESAWPDNFIHFH